MPKRKRKITSLKEVRTDEVSLVESGANLKGRFPIMKSAKEGSTMEDILVNVLKAEGKSEAIQKLEDMMDKEEMPEDAKSAVMAAMKLLESFSDMMPVSDALRALRSASGDAEKYGDEMKTYEEKKEEEEAKKEEDDDTKKGDDMKKEEDDMEKEEEELKKSLSELPESARSVFADIWKSNQELVAKSKRLEGELGEEIAKRERREYIKKAEKRLCNIPGHSLEQVVDLVLEAKTRSGSLGDRVEKALEAASNALQGGAVLVEAGRNVPDATMANDAWGKIQTLAKRLQQDNTGKMTMQQATSQVILSNPELYQQYKAER